VIGNLADLYGVSSIPVREALSALSAEGLVEYVPRRGYYVTSPDYVLLLNHLDLLQTLLVEAAFYIAASEVRRKGLLKVMNRHFPVQADGFAVLSPFEASSAIAQIFHESGRFPHSQIMERIMFSLAGTVHARLGMAKDHARFHGLVRNYFKAIAWDLPDLSEFGVKRLVAELRMTLLETLRIHH
jgi:DNA-binding GntR family transcriptional regulator